MEWLEVTVYTTNEGIEPVSGRLYQVGIGGVSIEDETEFLDFLENNKGSWDYVDDDLLKSMHKETTVKFYVPKTADGMETLASAKATLDELKEYDTEKAFGRLELSTENLKEEDWANNWKQYFHPIKIGDRILVKPEWEETENEDARLVFSINPGMSFGTGSHHTTKMCIEYLENAVTEGCNMLDLGCGSGILSIISILLGAKEAFAIDIDPLAADIAKDNAALNNVEAEKLSAVAGNIITDEALKAKVLENQYDIVAANIVADVIIAIAPFAYKAVKAGGIFITSGIIEDRMDDVTKALEGAGFEIRDVKRSADWAAFYCIKN